MSAVPGVRKQTTLLSQDSLRDFEKISNEWTASVRRAGKVYSPQRLQVPGVCPGERGKLGTKFAIVATLVCSFLGE